MSPIALFWSCSGVDTPTNRTFPSSFSLRRTANGSGFRFQARVHVWSWRMSIRSVPRLQALFDVLAKVSLGVALAGHAIRRRRPGAWRRGSLGCDHHGLAPALEDAGDYPLA